MIEITYSRRVHELIIKGHSGTGEKTGKDIICAGVSALACTLAQDLRILERRGAVTKYEMRLEEGDTRLACVPTEVHAEQVELVMDALIMGMAMMADSYPQNVSYAEI